MRKSFFTIAAFASISPMTQAQSRVTLYGVNNGSRFGPRGSEDLGGGPIAVFQLEKGFDVSNGKLGQGGLMFGRQAFVGLSISIGILNFGRQ